jgi:hypothetical protein
MTGPTNRPMERPEKKKKIGRDGMADHPMEEKSE